MIQLGNFIPHTGEQSFTRPIIQKGVNHTSFWVCDSLAERGQPERAVGGRGRMLEPVNPRAVAMHRRENRMPAQLGVEQGKLADHMRTIGRILPDDAKREMDGSRDPLAGPGRPREAGATRSRAAHQSGDGC